MVGVVAEKPGGIISTVHLLPNQNQVAPAIVPIDLADLPERVEAWGGLDRLVWQDADSSRLTEGQMQALQGWVAGGGRLVVVGGTTGPNTLSAFPDALLPYRPSATRRCRGHGPRWTGRRRPGKHPGSHRPRRPDDRGPRAARER